MDYKLNEIVNNTGMMDFNKTDDILADMQEFIETAQKRAYHAVNILIVQRNWLIGYRIAIEKLGEADRADYGASIIKKLSEDLTERYGKGFDRSNLYHCLKF